MIAAIWAFIRGIGSKAWLYLGIAAAALITVAMIFRAGKQSVQVDGLEDQLKNVGIRNEVENAVRRAGPDAVHDELQRDWRRD